MAVTALIFAGGTGSRMKITTKPKQFLELDGKAIIIHTLEHFENHPEVDHIVVVCVEGWIDYLNKLLKKFDITKVRCIAPGGVTGQMSIFNGLVEASNIKSSNEEDIVIIHDGVRPLIDANIISDNIKSVRENGTAVTVKPVIETVVQVNSDSLITNVVERDSCQTAVGPQSYYLKDIMDLHLKAQADNLFDMTDSSTLADYYGLKLYTVMGGSENIKITTPSDFYIFRAIYEARQDSQIFGL